MQLLHIDSSITGDHSVSRQLTARTVAAWVGLYPDSRVQYLDLALLAVPHLVGDSLGFCGVHSSATRVQRGENLLTEALLSQFLEADVVVIGAPMYNFSIPTQLKAWIDRVAQVGRTFYYTEQGAKGLAGGKTVIVALSRGGVYSTSEEGRAMEHQQSYLQTVLNFFGISDVRFLLVEGVAMGSIAKATALASAECDIQRLVGDPGAQSKGAIPSPPSQISCPRNRALCVLDAGHI